MCEALRQGKKEVGVFSIRSLCFMFCNISSVPEITRDYDLNTLMRTEGKVQHIKESKSFGFIKFSTEDRFNLT